MRQCLLLYMGFKNYFCNISIHRQKKNCLAYWNLQTWSLQREGKIIPTACLTRPVHLPTFKNMEMNMIDRLAPTWTFIHHHLIALLQAQISSTFLANNHQMTKKTFHHHLLLQKSGIYVFWVSPENVSVLEGKCQGKQNTGHPYKWFWLGFLCESSSWRWCRCQAGRPEPWWSHLPSLPPSRVAGWGEGWEEALLILKLGCFLCYWLVIVLLYILDPRQHLQLHKKSLSQTTHLSCSPNPISQRSRELMNAVVVVLAALCSMQDPS